MSIEALKVAAAVIVWVTVVLAVAGAFVWAELHARGEA
jgi:hypothetical protein